MKDRKKGTSAGDLTCLEDAFDYKPPDLSEGGKEEDGAAKAGPS